ncbi:MAG: response regulator transcription factor [Nannocystaceae bacterium]|nr:response regulator transcription factor [Nannocystaceae bacterium]
MTPTILIVDDERDLVSTVRFSLEREGWGTRVAFDGRTALEAAEAQPRPDLILLDLMLPDMSGTEICRELRSKDNTKDIPIVMVTAKGDEIDRVVGFEVGADDYVAKPFSIRELLLRIKAILRRIDEPSSASPQLAYGRLKVDPQAHRVWVDEGEIELTALEFRLLSTFLSRRGRVQTRDTLLHDVWGHSPGLPTRTVDTHVQRLRRKLGPASDYIETLRGVGYRFRTDRAEGVPA